ncbi:MAG: DNA primase, partial [Lachnospiraceae bacterium]|nr:DNA primase [Lachnospiraceae bacterium]
MYYSDEIIEEVRKRSDIVAVISRYVNLKKKGSNHWGCCPFHNEKTPSFSVSESKQMFYCFGCRESGNVYTFLMKYENYSFPEAVRALAEMSGVNLTEVEYTEEQQKKISRRQRLLNINKDAATFFYFNLRQNPHGEVGLAYLKKRELTEETMKKFGLGYAGKNGGDLVKYLRQKGYYDDEIRDA